MTPRRARSLVTRAIARGDLVPQPCETCGASPDTEWNRRRGVDAHHRFGYQDPLRVVWLCRSCHVLEHGWPARRATEVVA